MAALAWRRRALFSGSITVREEAEAGNNSLNVSLDWLGKSGISIFFVPSTSLRVRTDYVSQI